MSESPVSQDLKLGYYFHNRPITSSSEVVKNEKCISCQLCGKGLSNNRTLLAHKKQVHKVNAKGKAVPEIKYECHICNKTFVRTSQLKFHIQLLHEQECVKYICEECGFQTKYKESLKKHKIMHQKKEFLCKEVRPKSHKCSVCENLFAFRTGLTKHLKTVHNLFPKRRMQNPKKCPLCPFSSYATQRKEMFNHFEKRHHITLQWERHKFMSHQEFVIWKKEMEKKTLSFYSKRGRTTLDNRINVYDCHRSGFFGTKSNSQRRLKTVGSCRINGFCPSSIRVTSLSDGLVEVSFLKTHVGHKKEVKYLALTTEEEMSIVKQMKSDIPIEKIMAGIKETISSEEEVQRIHRLKLRDFVNIATKHNLNTLAKQGCPEDDLNIEIQLQDLEASKDTALLVYKGQGVISDGLPHLEEQDFLLIYMTLKQKSVLEKCTENTICVDSNQLFSLRKQNFHSFMILAMNETRDGFPVAFMITNRRDEAVLMTFLDEVRQVTGPVSCDILMTDLSDDSYVAWQKVMGLPKSRVFCSWHVLNDWRENVNSRIANKEKREVTYNTLQILLREQNEDTMMRILSTLLSAEDEETQQFISYFNREFIIARQFTSWAHCFSTNAAINESMLCDDVIRTLKFSYLQAKRDQTLEETLCAILKVIRNKLFNLIVDVRLTKVHRKLQIVTINHRNSLKTASKVSIVQMDLDCWMVVPSKRTDKCCAVKRIESNCYNCRLQCLRCNTCVHEFICSCKHYAVDNNMCQHIHLVAQAIGVPSEVKEKPEDVIECDTVMMDFDAFEDNNTDYNVVVSLPPDEEVGKSSTLEEGDCSNTQLLEKDNKIIKQIEKETVASTLTEEKTKFLEEMSTFLEINLTDKEEFDVFKKKVQSLMTNNPNKACDLETVLLKTNVPKENGLITNNPQNNNMVTNSPKEPSDAGTVLLLLNTNDSKEKDSITNNCQNHDLVTNIPKEQSSITNNYKEPTKPVVAGNLTLPLRIPPGLPVFLIKLPPNKTIGDVVIEKPEDNTPK